MPMYSKCVVCHCNIPYRTKVCDEHKIGYERSKKDKYRNYDNNNEIRKARHTTRWRNLREEIIESQKGLCLCCYVQGQLNPVDCIHHITPAKEDLNLFYNKDNLIGLCSSCHKFIHSKNILGKDKLENYLVNLIK